MSYVAPHIVLDLSAFDVVTNIVKGADKRMATLQRQRVPASRRRVRRLLAAPDSLPDLPFIWSYNPAAQARGRRGYFAKLKSEGKYKPNGGRYKRTGKLERNATVRFIKLDNGGEFQLLHDADAWDYVYGEKQVPSHYLTGWAHEDDVMTEEANTLSSQIKPDWYFVNTGEWQ